MPLLPLFVAHLADALLDHGDGYQKTENDLTQQDKRIDSRVDQSADKIGKAVGNCRPNGSVQNRHDEDRQKTDFHAPHSRGGESKNAAKHDG